GRAAAPGLLRVLARRRRGVGGGGRGGGGRPPPPRRGGGEGGARGGAGKGRGSGRRRRGSLPRRARPKGLRLPRSVPRAGRSPRHMCRRETTRSRSPSRSPRS